MVQVAPVLATGAFGIGVLAATHIRGETARVYWAEDAVDDQYLIKQALATDADAPKVDFFPNGKALLAAVTRRRPDLVVLDLNMPLMDGLSTLKALRQRKTVPQIPVVVFSTARNDAEVQALQELGIADYVQKPVPLEQFNSAVRRILAWA